MNFPYRRKLVLLIIMITLLLFILMGCVLFIPRYNLQINVNPENAGEVIGNGKYIEGKKVNLTAYSNDGYHFINWTKDATNLSENSETSIIMPAYDIIVSANFKINSYKVTFVANGGTPSIIEISKTHGESLDNLPEVTRNGHKLIEWNTQRDGNGKSFTPDSIITDNIILYALWEGEYNTNNKINGTINIEHIWSKIENSNSDNYKNTLNNNNNNNNNNIKDKIDYIPNQIIIGFNELTTSSVKESLFNSIEAKVLKSNNRFNAYLLEINSNENIFFEIDKLLNDSSVMFAEPNYVYYAQYLNIPNDKYFASQWNHSLIRLPQAWKTTTGEKSIRIAVLDTGVDSNHEDLIHNIDSSSGYNFIDDNFDYNDNHGHGTHVSGIIGATTNNDIGISGIMWDCEIVPVKVLSDKGYGSAWTVAQGILYAAGELESVKLSNPVNIINMSLSSRSPSSLELQAIRIAAEKGIIIVASTGNDNDKIGYPANYEEVIAVGATNYNYLKEPEKAYYSNFGHNIDLVAPGGDLKMDSDKNGEPDGILSTKNKYYEFSSGTSMAAPHVSGVIGLMLSNDIDKNNIRKILHETTFDLGNDGFNEYTGHGLVNSYWAVNSVNKITLFIGNLQNNTFYTIREVIIRIKDKEFSIDNIPEETYRILALIDGKNNRKIEFGDYWTLSGDITFEKDKIYDLELLLRENRYLPESFNNSNYNTYHPIILDIK